MSDFTNGATECFCDKQYKDANKLESCGDCPRDYIVGAWCARRKYVEDRLQKQSSEIEVLRKELAVLKVENEMLRKSLKDADNELDWLDEDVDTCDHSVGVCMCDYWNMRRKMKAALAQETRND